MTDAEPMTEGRVILEAHALRRSFRQGGEKVEALRGVDLRVCAGEVVALVGPSGSGKSTLLQTVGLLEGGYEGQIAIDGHDCTSLSIAERAHIRLKKLGFIYQFHHLMPDFSAIENVELALLVAGYTPLEAHRRAGSLLLDLGLKGRLSHRPSQLSGGEQQRVAAARAMANEPVLILADEPTGNLDAATGQKLFDEFVRLARVRGSTILLATHNDALARAADRVIALHDGRIIGELP